jgi:hypothetical protein
VSIANPIFTVLPFEPFPPEVLPLGVQALNNAKTDNKKSSLNFIFDVSVPND